MGKLEKVGAAVVGVLLCIIVFVGLFNQGNKPSEDGMSEADRETKRREATLRRDRMKDKPGKTVIDKGEGTLDLDDLKRRFKEEDEKKEALRKEAEAAKRRETEEANRGQKKPEGEIQPPKVDPVVVRGEWPKTYTVQKGDILGKICRKVYGTGRMTKAVLAANKGLNPRRLIPGKTVIVLPAPVESVVNAKNKKTGTGVKPVAVNRPAFISSAYINRHGGKPSADNKPEKGYYVVRKGDSLSLIAQKQLGSIKYAKALYQANRNLITNQNRLREGWKLKLPDVN